MQDTRRQILNLLQRQGSATIRDLAQSLDMAVATVRHHMTVLERDSLVESQKVRSGVGRPYLAYTLSLKGQESFPKKYDRLSSRVLAELRAELGAKGLADLMRRVAQGMVAESAAAAEGKPSEERAGVLVDLLGREGFVPEWEKGEEWIRLTQHTCPYQAVVFEHPVVCLVESELIYAVMGSPAERTACILSGDPVCTFEVKVAS